MEKEKGLYSWKVTNYLATDLIKGILLQSLEFDEEHAEAELKKILENDEVCRKIRHLIRGVIYYLEYHNML